MKRIYTILVAILLTASVFAQAPQKMTYQAVVRDDNSNLITSTQVGIEINIYQGSVTGTLVYTETQTPTTNVNGLLSIEIGGQTGFDTITWANGPYFLETKIDPNNSGTYTIIGVSQLLTVPYALHAKTAESISGTINENDPIYTSSQASNITSTDITNLSNLSGINTGDQDISGIATNEQAIQDTASQIRADIPDVSGFITNETDPVYSTWDKSYNDLTNTPNITDTVITILDTTTQFVRTELDGDPTNEIQTISRTDLTVNLTDGGSYQDSVNTQNLDNVLTVNNNGGAKQIKNIADPTDEQDAATKAYIDHKFDLLNIAMNGVTDYDGNHYNAVLIGNQIWMAEDLRVTFYPNGDPIPNITDNTIWGNLNDNDIDDAYCFYNNDNTTDYGALYTYSAAIGDNWDRDNVENQGVCPDGWHLPTEADWTTLIDYLGGESIAGGKMKEIGTTHWNNPNTGADNSSGFSALSTGDRRDYDGVFYALGNNGYWWSATNYSSNNAYGCYILYNNTTTFHNNFYKSNGFSIRCVKD